MITERAHDHIEDGDNRARLVEAAYRRGVQQALSFVHDYLTVHSDEPACIVLEDASDLAGEMRFDGKPHPLYLDELFETLNKRYESPE